MGKPRIKHQQRYWVTAQPCQGESTGTDRMKLLLWGLATRAPALSIRESRSSNLQVSQITCNRIHSCTVVFTRQILAKWISTNLCTHVPEQSPIPKEIISEKSFRLYDCRIKLPPRKMFSGQSGKIILYHVYRADDEMDFRGLVQELKNYVSTVSNYKLWIWGPHMHISPKCTQLKLSLERQDSEMLSVSWLPL